jgi:hypothetical protein
MRHTYRKHRGGSFRGPLSYVDSTYIQPSSGQGSNMLITNGQTIRPSMLAMSGGCGCGGLPAPIAARNISRNEPLYPAIHSRLIGGTRRRSNNRKNKQNGGCGCSGTNPLSLIGGSRIQKAGFSPAIIGPLVDNFHYIAPAVGLVAYRYYDQIKSRKAKQIKKKHSKRAHKK